MWDLATIARMNEEAERKARAERQRIINQYKGEQDASVQKPATAQLGEVTK
jgi:hypothetical protein